jgi:hypothetical protein
MMSERTIIAVVSDLLKTGLTVEQQILVNELALAVADVQRAADERRAWRETKRVQRLSKDSPKTPSPSPPMINNSTPLSPPQNKSVKSQPAEPLFDEFWGVYPLKVGKGAARKAYRNALSRASSDEILAGAKRYAASKPDPKFTAHPTTWLNADRWLDEAAKPSSNVSLGPWKPFTPENDPPKPPPEERERQVISRLKQLRPTNI